MQKMETTKSKLTQKQLGMILSLLNQRGWDAEQRHAFIYTYTNERTDSTKELTFEEARHLINLLIAETKTVKQNEAKKILKAIYMLSFEISFLNKGFRSDSEEERRMNYAKVNRFCIDRSRFRKPITQMTIPELQEIKKQFEALAHKEKQS